MVLLRKRSLVGFIEPCLPSAAKAPPIGAGWIHEIKHDGFRIMARRDGAGVRLITRNGNDFTKRFPLAAAAVAALPGRSCLIDGEAIVCDDKGVAVFELIRRARNHASVILCAFDLLEIDGEDLRRVPIEQRKHRLARLLRSPPDGIACCAWRHGVRMAARHPRAAGGEAADNRVRGHGWRPWTAAFEQRLSELGWIEGRTVAVEYRWAEGRPERHAEIATEFVRLKVDVVVTSVIPIVVALSADPVGEGLVASLARPGGNVTGLSKRTILLASASELLREVFLSHRRHGAAKHRIGGDIADFAAGDPNIARMRLQPGNIAFAVTCTHFSTFWQHFWRGFSHRLSTTGFDCAFQACRRAESPAGAIAEPARPRKR
jgi:hypothetical protein